MKIAFDITSMHIATGGVFYYDLNLLKALLRLGSVDQFVLLDYLPIHGGWRNPVQLASLKAPNAEKARVHGFRHVRLSRWKYAQSPVGLGVASVVDRLLERPLAVIAGASMQSALGRTLRDVDVFHISDVLEWAHPRAANVVTIHDLTTVLFPELHTEENRLLHERRLNFARQHADLILVGSESTRSDLVGQLGYPSDCIRVVPYGVDPMFQPVNDRAKLTRDLAPLRLEPDKYVLFVGTLEPRKNLVRLIKAFSHLREKPGHRHLKLALVGAMGWQYHDVLSTVRDLALEDQVVLTGPVADPLLPSLYSGARLFVYPSLYEGFGLPPLEAMACGTPVVASNVSSIPEVVGDAGILVDPTDHLGIADAMERLLVDNEAAYALRTAGLLRSARFSWARTARETLEAYYECADLVR